MQIKNWLLRQVAEKRLIKERYEYYTDAEKEAYDYRQEQLRRLEAGEDIDPPWVAFPNSDPMTLWISWRHGDGWLDQIWKPFWNKKNNAERKKYFEKWQPPNDDWYENITVYWDSGFSEKANWYQQQKKNFDAGKEVEPPWIVFPLSSPQYGWDTSYGEQWKLEIWLPFWSKLSKSEQDSYLEKWKSSEQWRETITNEWENKLKKSDSWFKQQIESVFQRGEVILPWQAFPKNDLVYEWDEKQIDKWLAEVWIPFWNELSEEKRDEYLEHKSLADGEWIEILAKYEMKEINKLKDKQNK
jgi:hypothetical protein